MKRPQWQCTCLRGVVHILGNSDYGGHTHSNIYSNIYYRSLRRAEDVSIEFNPLYNGQTPRDIEIRQPLGPTIGTWRI
eukprot:3599836-Amphidinium_carterae.3